MNRLLSGWMNAARTISVAPPEDTSEENPPPPPNDTQNEPDAVSPVSCASCGQQGASLRCAVCKIAFYCNKAHQAAVGAPSTPSMARG
ncbi:hypothetical protein AURDEDRAFT_114600 [Auricularia subglabra TFB-10046 SS5]|nr:hypothetical protein AURDEDRAFT_114600 [Auricularia subglabra TFB-10046 SS5]